MKGRVGSGGGAEGSSGGTGSSRFGGVERGVTEGAK